MSSGANSPKVYSTSIEDFQACLRGSTRVMALLGAGLSASSGLPTFRGPGGQWRTHKSQLLATPEAFRANPGLVWQFYNYRRHMALNVAPNPAHYALAELARRMPGFLTLSQNVDGLSPRAGHPADRLLLLHGNLFELACWDKRCGYREVNYTDPVVPALALPASGEDPTTDASLRARAEALDISDPAVPLPSVEPEDLPRCPKCRICLLRPGVIWFGESLPSRVLREAQAYVDRGEQIDIIMVIGTSSQVFPAASYVDDARARGARACVINMDENDAPAGGWYPGDWFFQGDAAVLVPKLLEPITGDVDRIPRESKV